MMGALVASVGHGSAALWYLTRATGLVSLIVLSATVVLGTVASVGWTTDRWPRFLSQSVHRNLSLFCLALIGVHVISTVGDGYVPIGLADAVLPFRSPYRPIWVGLGALALDMLLAVAITSALRRRIGVAAWRGVHWLAYACWPIAAVHGLGSGSDTRLPGAMLVFIGCTASVAAAVAWRLAVGRARSASWRLGGAAAGAAVLLVITAFAMAGPLRPGWSHRAGTSSALLAQLSSSAATSYSGATTTTNPSRSTSAPATSGIPTAPFQTSVSGTVATSAPNARGESQVVLTLRLTDTSTPLQIRIIGPAVNGGVEMRSSAVSFGALTGQVTALDGSNIGAVVNGSTGSLSLTMNLSLDPNAGTLTGQLSGSAAQ
jgi:sulfoxide reductase heme-binding subunit YedZ